jgi:hypothetical protein
LSPAAVNICARTVPAVAPPAERIVLGPDRDEASARQRDQLGVDLVLGGRRVGEHFPAGAEPPLEPGVADMELQHFVERAAGAVEGAHRHLDPGRGLMVELPVVGDDEPIAFDPERAARRIRDDLVAGPGIHRVRPGGQDRRDEIVRRRLAQRDLRLHDVVDARRRREDLDPHVARIIVVEGRSGAAVPDRDEAPAVERRERSLVVNALVVLEVELGAEPVAPRIEAARRDPAPHLVAVAVRKVVPGDDEASVRLDRDRRARLADPPVRIDHELAADAVARGVENLRLDGRAALRKARLVLPDGEEPAARERGHALVGLPAQGLFVDLELAADLRSVGREDLPAHARSAAVEASVRSAARIRPGDDEAPVVEGRDLGRALALAHRADQKLAADLGARRVEPLAADRPGEAEQPRHVGPHRHEAAVGKAARMGRRLGAGRGRIDEDLAADARPRKVEHLRLDRRRIGVAALRRIVGPGDEEPGFQSHHLAVGLALRRRTIDQELAPDAASVGREHLPAHGAELRIAAGLAVVVPHHDEIAVGELRDRGPRLVAERGAVRDDFRAGARVETPHADRDLVLREAEATPQTPIYRKLSVLCERGKGVRRSTRAQVSPSRASSRGRPLRSRRSSAKRARRPAGGAPRRLTAGSLKKLRQ